MDYERGLRTHGIEKPPVMAPRVGVGLRELRKRQKGSGSGAIAGAALGAGAAAAAAGAAAAAAGAARKSVGRNLGAGLGARSATTRSSHLAWVIL